MTQLPLPVPERQFGTAGAGTPVSNTRRVLASRILLVALLLALLIGVFAVAMAATTVGDLLRSTVFPLLRWVQTVAALLLIAAGGYIIVYQVRGGLW